MPRKEAIEATPKKDRLTLSQLAGYDDILTDALVDHACTMQPTSKAPLADLYFRFTSGQ